MIDTTENQILILPDDSTLDLGKTTQITLLLNIAPDGLSGYNLTVRLTNPAVAEIVGVQFPPWAMLPTNSTIPADSIWCKAADLTGASGTVNITLVTVTVRGDSAGATNITVVPDRVEDRQGGRYTPGIQEARLTVGSAPIPPVANFTAIPTSGKVPLTVNFTDQSTGVPTEWLWNFGDNTTSDDQNPSYTYSSAGSYTVSLTVTNDDGSDTLTKQDYITVESPIQQDTQITLLPPTSSLTTGQIHEYAVILDIAPDGLSGYNLTVRLTNPAVAEIVGVQFPPWAMLPTNSSTPSDSVWCKAADLTGASGTVNITLVTVTVRGDSAGLTNITVVPDRVEDRQGGRYTPGIQEARLTVGSAPPPPVAAFTATPINGTAPLKVQFTDTSTGDPNEWLWDFGDNTTSDDQNPSHTFRSAGSYTVSLTVTNDDGTDTLTKQDYITVTPSPHANITAVLESNINYNRWTSDDVLMSGTGDSRITYFTSVHNTDLSEGTINGSITFLLDADGVVNQSLDPKQYAEMNGTEVRWNFPETTEIQPGTALSTSAATSIFTPKESGVTLERTTNRTHFHDAGVQDAIFNITFDTIPPSGIWGRVECANTTNVSSTFIPGTVRTDLPLFYLNEGMHRIEYRINQTMIEAGKQYFISAAVAVDPDTPTIFAPGISVWEIINTSRTDAPNGTMVTVPDSLLPENASNVSFSSATPCIWEIARNDHIISSISQRAAPLERSPPIANFTATPTSGAAGFTVRFNDTSTGDPDEWFWNFGDGSNSTEQNPVHTYTTPGTYNVTLTASNAGGSDTVTEQNLITVHIRGDFNGNGRVDVGDVAKVAWMAVGLIESDPAANFKGEGEVDAADAAWIAYYYVGKIPTL